MKLERMGEVVDGYVKLVQGQGSINKVQFETMLKQLIKENNDSLEKTGVL